MSNTYDDSKYGVVERMEFLPWQAKKTLVNDSTILKRYYPKGPIKILKFGVRHLATQGGTDSVIQLSCNAQAVATVVASTDATPWRIASKESLSKTVNAGSYLTITNNGTVATGSVACFIDYVRLFHANWDT